MSNVLSSFSNRYNYQGCGERQSKDYCPAYKPRWKEGMRGVRDGGKGRGVGVNGNRRFEHSVALL